MYRFKSVIKDAVQFVTGMFDLEPPVDPIQLAEELGIKYRCEPIYNNVYGMWFRTSNGQPYIIVNEYQPDTRRLFTSVHECAHELVAQRLNFTYDLCLDKKGTKKTPLERACDKIAANILMPREAIIPWYFDLEDNKLCRVDILAYRCGVSKQAMSIRLKELHLTP